MKADESGMFYLERKNRRAIRTAAVEKIREVADVAKKTLPPPRG